MKKIKDFKGFKLILDEQGSGNEKMLLEMTDPVADYVIKGFDVTKDDTVIDIGAHVGRFSIYAASNGKQVYSYEPDTRNINKLKENIEVNNLNNISYFQKVVNETGESVKFYLSDNPSENSLFETNTDLPHIEVQGTTLKNIFDSNNIETCGFLKLDCEGAEYEILSSLPRQYFERIDRISLEYHDHLHKTQSLKDLVKILSKNNFKIPKITRGAWYTGLLYARKSKTNPILHNYFRVYVLDMFLFVLELVKKRLFKK